MSEKWETRPEETLFPKIISTGEKVAEIKMLEGINKFNVGKIATLESLLKSALNKNNGLRQ